MFQKLINYYYMNRLKKIEMKIQETEIKIKYNKSSLEAVDDSARADFYQYSGFSASAYHADKCKVEIDISNMNKHLNLLETRRNNLTNKLNLTNKNAN